MNLALIVGQNLSSADLPKHNFLKLFQSLLELLLLVRVPPPRHVPHPLRVRQIRQHLLAGGQALPGRPRTTHFPQDHPPKPAFFQVEYAIEAIKLGSTAIGIQTSEGVVLAVEKRITSTLMEPTTIEKIVEVDKFVGCAFSGLTADSKMLIDRAR